MAFLSSLNISGSALTAQRLRMEVITQNIANATTTMTPEGTPYARQQVAFEERNINFEDALKNATTASPQNGGVRVTEIVESDEPFVPVYDPEHPHANEDGYVMMPNVNMAEEQVDLMAATRAYEANITALNVVKAMSMKALEIGK